MIDPGHPFSISYRDLIESLEESIKEGVEQPDKVKFTFKGSITSYEMPTAALGINRVTGLNKEGLFTVFQKNMDYIFRNNRIIWQEGAQFPREGSRFEVEFTYRERPPGLNDFRPGSVTGTLIRTVARQMKLMYEQMDQAYRRAFIDIAAGVALDNVVAILGVSRNPALKATGEVTFFLKKPADKKAIFIRANTRITDESGRAFITTEDATIYIGESEVTVPIEAKEPGLNGNVNAGTIIIMPSPPSGVNGVINRLPTEGGKEAEPDDQLRERAKHELERSGNATLNAIRFSVLDIDEVDDVQVIDNSIDPNIPLGEVRVRYSGLASEETVKNFVEKTRAAGIMARLERVKEIMISGTYYLIPDINTLQSTKGDFLLKIIDSIDSLKIGQSLSLRRLNALSYETAGLAEVAEAQLRYPDPENPGMYLDVPDPFLIKANELIRADEAHLDAGILQSLKAKDTKKVNADYLIELQMIDDTDTEVHFKDFSIDLDLGFQAGLKNLIGQTENIGSLRKRIEFKDSDTASLTITPDDIERLNFRGSDHEPDVTVFITIPAYPAIRCEDAAVTITIAV